MGQNDDQCVVSPGLGGASSSSATFFRSSPNERSTSGLTLLRKTTWPSGVTAMVRPLKGSVLQALADERIRFAKYFESIAQLPLIERKEWLQRLFRKDINGLRYSEHVAGNGPRFRAQACKLGLEGAISKRADRPYAPGDRGIWVKSTVSRGTCEGVQLTHSAHRGFLGGLHQSTSTSCGDFPWTVLPTCQTPVKLRSSPALVLDRLCLPPPASTPRSGS
jgi:hypothetical protein